MSSLRGWIFIAVLLAGAALVTGLASIFATPQSEGLEDIVPRSTQGVVVLDVRALRALPNVERRIRDAPQDQFQTACGFDLLAHVTTLSVIVFGTTAAPFESVAFVFDSDLERTALGSCIDGFRANGAFEVTEVEGAPALALGDSRAVLLGRSRVVVADEHATREMLLARDDARPRGLVRPLRAALSGHRALRAAVLIPDHWRAAAAGLIADALGVEAIVLAPILESITTISASASIDAESVSGDLHFGVSQGEQLESLERLLRSFEDELRAAHLTGPRTTQDRLSFGFALPVVDFEEGARLILGHWLN